MTKTKNKITRYEAFRRVLAEATKRPPSSPALLSYYAATSNAERRVAYAALTQDERDALIENACKIADAQVKDLAEKRRAEAASIKSLFDANAATAKTIEDARIAALPPVARRRARFKRVMLFFAQAIWNWLWRILVFAFILGNILTFCLSLIYHWAAWALLFGTLMAVSCAIMIVAHRRTIISIVKTLPEAIYAAITRGAKRS
jgi:hypothetical protein